MATKAAPGTAPRSMPSSAKWPYRIIGGAIALAHVAVIEWVCAGPLQRIPGPDNAMSEVVPITAVIVSQPDVRYPIPLPAIRLQNPVLSDLEPADIEFEDPDANTVRGVIGGTSAPRPTAAQDARVEAFAQRAGLTAGESVTVVLTVEVLKDGSSGQVSVLVSSGDPTVDQQAVGYAAALHWVPGTVHRNATAMHINFPVTLNISG